MTALLPLQFLFAGILITTENSGLSAALASFRTLSKDTTKLITLLYFWQQKPLQLNKLGPKLFSQAGGFSASVEVSRLHKQQKWLVKSVDKRSVVICYSYTINQCLWP